MIVSDSLTGSPPTRNETAAQEDSSSSARRSSSSAWLCCACCSSSSIRGSGLCLSVNNYPDEQLLPPLTRELLGAASASIPRSGIGSSRDAVLLQAVLAGHRRVRRQDREAGVPGGVVADRPRGSAGGDPARCQPDQSSRRRDARGGDDGGGRRARRASNRLDVQLSVRGL